MDYATRRTTTIDIVLQEPSARREAPLGFADPPDERTIEYDELPEEA